MVEIPSVLLYSCALVERPRTRAPVPWVPVHATIHRHQQSPWTVLTVAGELDVVGAPDLRQAVVSAVSDGQVLIMLDLTDTDFIDSFGLGVIIGSLKRVRQRNGELAIVCPEARIRRVFELCDLDRVFSLYSAVAEVPDPIDASR